MFTYNILFVLGCRVNGNVGSGVTQGDCKKDEICLVSGQCFGTLVFLNFTVTVVY